jgi:hypothetical protein
MTHRPNGWQGTWNSSDSQAESSDIPLKVESMFATSLHISDFVQTQNKAKILTICTDAVWTVDMSRPDGQLYNRIFEIFAENLSCLRAVSGRSHVRCKWFPYKAFTRPDQGGWPSGRLIFNTQFPYKMSARPDHDRQVSGRLKLNAQFPYLLNARPDQVGWTSGRLYLNCNSWLMYERVQTGIHVVRTVASIFPYLNLERKSEAYRSLDVVGTGCWDVQTDASWNRSFSMQWRVRTEIHVVQTNDARSVWAFERYGTSSGRMEQWTDERSDGMTRRPDGWQGTDFSDCRIFLNTSE